MNPHLRTAGRVLITAMLVAAAALVAWRMWQHYERDPWTRDGRIRADVVEIAPDVSGLVTQVLVHDNQPVRKGQLLFVIDRPRYALAAAQAQAALASQKAVLVEARREAGRNAALGDLVSQEAREQGLERVSQASAALDQAQANLDVARLNLARISVAAPVDGVLASVALRPGEYLAAGHPALALVDSASVHVDGYFEETKLRRIRIGDHARIHVMGEPEPLLGHVQSIAAAISDRERTESANLLPNVNPTVSWVRLAQRVPVRIVLDKAPADIRLIAGRTATVTIAPTGVGPRR